MPNVFISYRRDDAGGHAGRLSDRLCARFGPDSVFVDVDDIKPGQNFLQAIEQTLSRCEYLLAVIGPRWLESLKARLTKHEDFVRHEIVVAMSRNMTVIPVLVGGAKMPDADDLPEELAPFARCQAVEIRDNRFDEDAADLVVFLAGKDTTQPVNLMGMRVNRRALITAVAALVIATIGAGWFARHQPAPEVIGEPSIDGEWVADMQRAGQPPYSIHLMLMRAGSRVNGLVKYPTGDGPILDGVYDAGTMTFRTEHTPQFESEPATIQFQARVQGDAINLTLVNNAGTAIGTAHRVVSTPAARPSLAYGQWTLRNARDEQGKIWNNSVLQITSQEDAADGLLLKGRFTWRLDNLLIGTEDISGHYLDRTRQIILEGSTVSDPARLAVGSYSAVLAPDERALLQGRWGSTAQNEPGYAGEWEATR